MQDMVSNLKDFPVSKEWWNSVSNIAIEVCISCIERIFPIWEEAVLEQSLEGKRSFPGKERMWNRKNIPDQTESFRYYCRWYR